MSDINTWPGWQCVRQLGAGSFGKVYEIKREEFGKTYSAALKVITIPPNPAEVQNAYSEGMDEQSVTSYFQDIVESIMSEFALMSDLKGHTNIVSYEDHMVVKHEDEIGWDILIRMELLTPLPRWSEIHPMKEEDVLRMGCDICQALELCQKKNILHRDIKPENIFVNEYGNYKLGDFGIARTIEKTISSLSQKGTYTYIAPEVYHGRPYGVTADIYSLGIVLYRYLNENRIPFLPMGAIRYSDRQEAFEKRISGVPVPPPAGGSQRLKEVILQAVSYTPEKRFLSAAALHKALLECTSKAEEADERTLLLFEPGQKETNIKSGNLRRKAPVFAGIALAGAVALIYALLTVFRENGRGNVPEPVNAGAGTVADGRNDNGPEGEDTRTEDNRGEAGAETGSGDQQEGQEQSEAEAAPSMMFQKVIDFEKNKWWDEKHIVGTAYMPDEEEMEMINHPVDYTDWDVYLEAYYASFVSDEPVSEVGLLSQTENFILYERNQNESRRMLIETPDHSYLLAEMEPISSTGNAQPVIVEADYDQDGENELAVQVYLLHGTGLSVDSLFMADKASDGQWYLFQLLNEECSEILRGKYSRTKIGDQYYFRIEDRTIAVPQTVLEYHSFMNYAVGNLIHVECSPEGILLKAEIGSELKDAPDYNYNLGNGISAAVSYCGDGEWELTDFDYYNDQLEDYVKGVTYCYLTGDVQRAETEYNITFEVPEQIVPDCTITKISYDSDAFGYDQFKVAIEYTADGMEKPKPMQVWVRLNDLDAMGITDLYDVHSYDLWTIVSIY